MVYLNFNTIFEFLGQFYCKIYISFFKKVLIILRWRTKHANFWLGVQWSLNSCGRLLQNIDISKIIDITKILNIHFCCESNIETSKFWYNRWWEKCWSIWAKAIIQNNTDVLNTLSSHQVMVKSPYFNYIVINISTTKKKKKKKKTSTFINDIVLAQYYGKYRYTRYYQYFFQYRYRI